VGSIFKSFLGVCERRTVSFGIEAQEVLNVVVIRNMINLIFMVFNFGI